MTGPMTAGNLPGKRIKQFCVTHHLTQRVLAQRLAVSEQYLSRLINGRLPMTASFSVRWREALGEAACEAVFGAPAPVAQMLVFPPHQVEPLPAGLYEAHCCDATLFSGDLELRLRSRAKRRGTFRERWDVEELLAEMTTGTVTAQPRPAVLYEPPVEQWFTPPGETCVAYGLADVAEPV